MLSRLCSSIVLSGLFLVPASAQTVRFDTNVGTFDMELNPTGNAGLQPYVDNLLAYVNAGRYDLSVINRAADNADGGFVLQMGGFQATTLTQPANFSDFTPVPSFPNLIQDTSGDNIIDLVDANAANLTNSRGTVAFAMSNVDGNPDNPSDVNSATREFFVNVGTNNTFLDATGGQGGFVPFAEVSDLATVDLIMGLSRQQTSDNDGLSSDMPILDSNHIVFIERVFVLETTAEDMAMMMAEGDEESSSSLSSSLVSNPPPSLQALSVPEPPALVLALGALVMIYVMKPSKRG